MLGAAVVVLAVVAILQVDAGAPPLARGSSAPAFELRVLGSAEGTAESRLALSDLRGRVVLVNFWATWCEPCESEMPAMERLYGLLPRDEFEMVAVAIDDDESLVQGFQDEYALSFPIVLDLDQAVYQSYQTMGVPESLLIDRQGRVVERYVGPREWDAPEHVQRLQDVIEDRGA
ncbi:MAG: TlpA family protein disulfide reductase [bacterium]|nr:TlpA family protein disulfide reductase [bacterium]